MILGGEGTDEMFGGYLYFRKAPNPEELHKETTRKLGKLYQYDSLRSRNSMVVWGVGYSWIDGSKRKAEKSV